MPHFDIILISLRRKVNATSQTRYKLLIRLKVRDRLAAYVKSDVDLAKHDGEQGNGYHRCRCNAQKHTNHENSLFHLNSPSQVSVTQPILPVWRKFLKDYVAHMVLSHQYLVVGYFLQGARILQRFIGL